MVATQIFGTFIFVVSNKVECLDQQTWFVELMVVKETRHEDFLHLSIVEYWLVQELNIA
jgi:hypothetical protein